MGLLMVIVVVAVLFLGGSAFAASGGQKELPKTPEPNPGISGSEVFKDIAGGAGAAAGIAASLAKAFGGSAAGGTAAGTGGLASGGTAASGTGSSFSVGTTGTVTEVSEASAGGGSAAADASAVASFEVTADALSTTSTGLAIGFFAVIILFWLLAGGLQTILANATEGKRRNWETWCRSKRRYYFSSFWGLEQDSLWKQREHYQRTAGVIAADGESLPSTGWVTASDGVDYQLGSGGQYISQIVDTRMLASAPALLAIARWQAIHEMAARNQAIYNFFVSLGWTVGHINSMQGFLDEGANCPAMYPEEYWQLAEEYARVQPFAAPAATFDSRLGTIATSRYGSTAPVVAQASLLPPGPIQETSIAALNERVGQLLGPSYASEYQKSQDLGACIGMVCPAIQGYSIAWPGDEAFTAEIANRCGTDFFYKQVGTTAGEIRWCLVNGRIGFDVVRSRELGRPIVYTPEMVFGGLSALQVA